MNGVTEHHLQQLGFEDQGNLAESMDHAVYTSRQHGFGIVVPKKGCPLPDLAQLIYLAGQSDARAQIRRDYLKFTQNILNMS